MPIHNIRVSYHNPELFRNRLGPFIASLTDEAENWLNEHLGMFNETNFIMGAPVPELAPGEWFIINTGALGEDNTTETGVAVIRANCDDTIAVLCRLRWG